MQDCIYPAPDVNLSRTFSELSIHDKAPHEAVVRETTFQEVPIANKFPTKSSSISTTTEERKTSFLSLPGGKLCKTSTVSVTNNPTLELRNTIYNYASWNLDTYSGCSFAITCKKVHSEFFVLYVKRIKFLRVRLDRLHWVFECYRKLVADGHESSLNDVMRRIPVTVTLEGLQGKTVPLLSILIAVRQCPELIIRFMDKTWISQSRELNDFLDTVRTHAEWGPTRLPAQVASVELMYRTGSSSLEGGPWLLMIKTTLRHTPELWSLGLERLMRGQRLLHRLGVLRDDWPRSFRVGVWKNEDIENDDFRYFLDTHCGV